MGLHDWKLKFFPVFRFPGVAGRTSFPQDEQLWPENEDGSGITPGQKAPLDQGAAPEQSGVLVHEIADHGPKAGDRLRRSSVPKPLGMLGPRHRYLYDRR